MRKLVVSSVLSNLVNYLLLAKELLNIDQACANLESVGIYYTYIETFLLCANLQGGRKDSKFKIQSFGFDPGCAIYWVGDLG